MLAVTRNPRALLRQRQAEGRSPCFFLSQYSLVQTLGFQSSNLSAGTSESPGVYIEDNFIWGEKKSELTLRVCSNSSSHSTGTLNVATGVIFPPLPFSSPIARRKWVLPPRCLPGGERRQDPGLWGRTHALPGGPNLPHFPA